MSAVGTTTRPMSLGLLGLSLGLRSAPGVGNRRHGRCIVRRNEQGALPAVVDVETAGRMLGVGRGLAYELVRTGR